MCLFCTCTPQILDSSTWLIVIEEMLPYVIFASRWVLPRGRVRREELAELLFAFIEIAADIMEFFSLIGDNVIRGDKTLSYCVLSIWSLSILQFTMTVTVIHQPKREKKVMVVVVESNTDKERERVRHQCFAIFLTMVMQDLPFAIMRLYTIIKFDYINYSLIFFTSKNLIIIMLLLYKVAALCKNRYQRDHESRGRDTDTKTPLNIDGAEKGSKNNIDTFSTSSLGRIGKQEVTGSNNEQYTDQNHFKGSVDSVLKKRSRKQEISNKGSVDSGRTTPQSLTRSTTESEDTASRQSIHLQKTDSVGYVPQLCLNCLSRIETSDFQNIWNMMNLPSHFRTVAGSDDGFQHPPHPTERVESVSRRSQGSIEEMRFSAGQAGKESEHSDEIKGQSPDSAVTSLVIAVGNKQQQMDNGDRNVAE